MSIKSEGKSVRVENNVFQLSSSFPARHRDFLPCSRERTRRTQRGCVVEWIRYGGRWLYDERREGVEIGKKGNEKKKKKTVTRVRRNLRSRPYPPTVYTVYIYTIILDRRFFPNGRLLETHCYIYIYINIIYLYTATISATMYMYI